MLTVSAYQLFSPSSSEVEGNPGAIQMYAKPSSLNHILATLSHVVIPLALQDKTIQIDTQMSFEGVNLSLTSITPTEIRVGSSDISFVDPESDTLQVVLSDMNMTASVVANVTTDIHLIPMVLEQVTLTNMTLQATLATLSQDAVHWQLKETAFMHLGDLDCHFKEKLYNKVFKEIKPEVMGVINYSLALVAGVTEGLVDALNFVLAHEQAMTFELPIMGMPLNLTMSRYPQLSNAEDLISINLDGRFFDKQT